MSPGFGRYRPSLLEKALTTAAMIGAADRIIVLVEAAKFGQRCFARIAPLASIDDLVTDNEPPSDLAQALGAAEVQVILARKG